MQDLVRLDITKLAYVFTLSINAGNFTIIDHETLEGFTSDSGYGGVEIGSAAVESVDSFFKRPIHLSNTPGMSYISTTWHGLPNVRNMTIGWSRVGDVSIRGGNVSVTLGTSNTTDIEIGRLTLDGNITDLEYHPNLKNLTIGDFIMEPSKVGITQFDLSFTPTSSIVIRDQLDLEVIRLPAEAEHWERLSLNISVCPKLNLSSEYIIRPDGEEEKIWYWPQNDMSGVRIFNVPSSNEFV